MSEHAYDKWKTTTPADSAHNEGCSCKACHEWHMDEGDVLPNAAGAGGNDYQCCQDQVEGMIHDGDLCAKHWGEHYSEKGMCEGCDKEKEVMVRR